MPERRVLHAEHEPRTEAFCPVRFYACAFGIAWAAWLPLLLHKWEVLRSPLPFVVVLFVGQTIGAFAPVLSLFALQRICNDPQLVHRVFHQWRFRGVAHSWYLVPALVPIGVTVVLNLFNGWLSGEELSILRPEPVQQLGWALLVVMPLQFVLGMIGSPLGEEPGWRGYVLDGFARRGRAVAGSSIVASLWWIWHLPLLVVLDVDPTAATFLSLVGHSLLLDSLFLLSRHNLLVAMLYHQGINTSFLFFISKSETPSGSIVLLLVALIVRTGVEFSYRSNQQRSED